MAHSVHGRVTRTASVTGNGEFLGADCTPGNGFIRFWKESRLSVRSGSRRGLSLASGLATGLLFLGLSAFVAVLNGCHDDGFACRTNEDCAAGYHCEGDKCVADDGGVQDAGDSGVADAGPVSCESSQDCTDQARPICDDQSHQCRGCTDSSECEALSSATPFCNQDTGACTSSCGNGQIDEQSGEVCDGADLGGATCLTEAGLASGTLACSPDCRSLDMSGCYECGNGTVEGPEVCDGSDLTGHTCAAQASFDGGNLACGADCLEFDTSGCWKCGDGVCSLGAGENRENCAQDCGVVSFCAGGLHSCAVVAGGSVWCWGDNGSGQLGTGAAGGSETQPVEVPGLSDVVEIACYENRTCAVTNSGELYCWGDNAHGAVGSGGSDLVVASPTAVSVGGGTVAHVDPGKWHTCAVTTSGSLYCWGDNDHGQLGLGNITEYHTPREVTALSSVVDVSAGGGHTCAIDGSGDLWCWGANALGQLGIDSTVEQHEPAQVHNLSSVAQVSAGGGHTCALDGSAHLYCWGDNTGGKLGNGSSGSFVDLPTQISVPGAAQVSCGASHTCAVDSQNQAWCWGSNDQGQMGTGDNQGSSMPHIVSGFHGTSIDAGLLHTCALDTDGGLWCWGYNRDGELGNGSTTSSNVPVQVVW